MARISVSNILTWDQREKLKSTAQKAVKIGAYAICGVLIFTAGKVVGGTGMLLYVQKVSPEAYKLVCDATP